VHLGSQPEAGTLLLGDSGHQDPGYTHQQGQEKLAHGLHLLMGDPCLDLVELPVNDDFYLPVGLGCVGIQFG